jgi:hypothetical protein
MSRWLLAARVWWLASNNGMASHHELSLRGTGSQRLFSRAIETQRSPPWLGEVTGRHVDGGAPPEIDPSRVRSLKQAATAANISVPTLIRSGQGPKTIQLSERRLGARDRDFLRMA